MAAAAEERLMQGGRFGSFVGKTKTMRAAQSLLVLVSSIWVDVHASFGCKMREATINLMSSDSGRGG